MQGEADAACSLLPSLTVRLQQSSALSRFLGFGEGKERRERKQTTENRHGKKSRQ